VSGACLLSSIMTNPYNSNNNNNSNNMSSNPYDAGGLGVASDTMTMIADRSSEAQTEENADEPGVSPSLLLLQQQVGALQKELIAKQEANFELDAMIATMQAEMTHQIASVEASSKEERHKLQHELRMAQQEARQAQQAAKRQKLQHQVSQQNQAATSTFSKRLAAPAVQQEPNAGPSETSPKMSHRFPVAPSEDSSTDQQQPSCGQVLSRHLLETCSLGSVKSAACVQVLTYIASNPQSRWVETQLVWYLVHATVQQFQIVRLRTQGIAEVPQLEVCLQFLQHALTLSSTGREDVRQQFLGEASSSGSSQAPPPPRPSRIRKNGDTLVAPHIIEATTKQMQNSLWTPGSSSSPTSSSQSTMPDRSELANCLLLGVLRRLAHPRSVHILFTLIQDSDLEKWHTVCHTQVVEALKRSMAYQLQGEDPDEFDCGEPVPPPPSTPPPLSRIKHIQEFSYDDDVLEMSTLPALLVLQQRLLQTTNADNQDRFFSSPDGGACVHGMLDVLTSIGVQESQWELAEPYYLESIQWLQRVARFPQGMVLLRSRVPPVSGGNGDFMPNAIDVAITHMHKLTVTDDFVIHKKDMVLVQNCIEAWIRFLHQVLLYCQQPPATPSSPVVSFRSLLLDSQDLFTSACGLLLTNPLEKTPTSIRDECKKIIRLQLEELSLDEEEHEELKQSLPQP
jgi:hypothetical protein